VGDPVYDAAIVGAGLAGLRCAQHLQQAGRKTVVLESKERVGGRVKTDTFEGFLLDRGFQVLLTAYPEASRTLDLLQLDLQPFVAGASVRVDGRFHTIVDPWQRPSGALRTLRAPVGSLFDKLRIGLLRQRVQQGTVEDLFAHPEQSTVEYLRQFGFTERMIDHFFRPFFGGVFLESELRTSSRMLEFVFRMFSSGAAALPARGMGAIPEQMAAALPADSIRLSTKATDVDDEGVRLSSGEFVRTRAVVLATDGTGLSSWISDWPAVRSRSVTCLYFTADRSPLREPILVLNGERSGLVNNLCVPSDVSSEYAPPGAALISASVLGNPALDESALVEAVREQLQAWFGSQVANWRHLRTYRIAHALPETGPDGLAEPVRSVRLRDRLYVCGDHRETPSIEGALISGRRAAESILSMSAC
jgi:phytoene dehydrogenase-like protein